VYAIFLHFDNDKNGFMSVNEFADAINYERYTDRLSHEVLERIASSLVRINKTPQDLFLRLDRDRSGTLSRLEVEEVVLSLQPDLTVTEREAIYKKLDADNSGVIDLNEFTRLISAVNAAPLVALEDKIGALKRTFTDNGYGYYESFQAFDTNGDGFLSREEWRAAFVSLLPNLTAVDADAVFQRFDANGDGFMSLTEFSTVFQDSIDRRPQLQYGVWPTYTPPVVEASWETEILDLVKDCLSVGRSGLGTTEVFRRLDIDHDNTIGRYEFDRMIQTYRPDLRAEHLDSLFKKVNISNSGVISMPEFVRRFGS
jgi:Ca2+-binding EF-hand superfamily protein